MTEIRRAVREDLEHLLPLVRAFYDVDDHPFDRGRVERGLVPLLLDDTHGQVWVMADPSSGHLLGYAVVTWGWSVESGGRDSLLDELYVSTREEGLGTSLLRHAMSAATNFGATVMFLETEGHNARVRRFYQRHGFDQEQSIWMSRRLS